VNAAVRPQISAQLIRRGYRVVETATVQQTLAAAHQGLGAILLDTSPDGMNGWEILLLLRRLDPEARTPVVLLSVENRQKPESPGVNAEAPAARPPNDDALFGELAGVLHEPGEKARILVVEDDVDLARLIGDIFAPGFFAVELAHSLHQAQDVCLSFQPHLLVLDIGLPDGDGFNLVDWLRQHESLARLPLAIYSGHDLSPAERREIILGPTHFLSKVRVQPQQLEALVLTMLRSSRPMEEAAPVESPVGKP
jgi:DNA-binding response OmpR family regulator